MSTVKPYIFTSQPVNTWYCPICNFYVYNSKQQCSKCFTQKPRQILTQRVEFTDEKFDKEMSEYYRQQHLQAQTACSKCKIEGKDNKNNNCWKYN